MQYKTPAAPGNALGVRICHTHSYDVTQLCHQMVHALIHQLLTPCYPRMQKGVEWKQTMTHTT